MNEAMYNTKFTYLPTWALRLYRSLRRDGLDRRDANLVILGVILGVALVASPGSISQERVS